MNQVAHTIRHMTGITSSRVSSFLHLSAKQLLFWGLGLVAVLVPTAAYAWGSFAPTTSSVTTGDRNVSDTTAKVEKTTPAKIETSLNADVNGGGSPASDSAGSHASSSDQANIQLHINGQAVPVPPQGTVHKEISSNNGKTSVDFSVNSGSSGTSQSSSHTSMNIEMNSSTDTGSADEN